MWSLFFFDQRYKQLFRPYSTILSGRLHYKQQSLILQLFLERGTP